MLSKRPNLPFWLNIAATALLMFVAPPRHARVRRRVCQHGDNGTLLAGVGNTGDGPCTLRNQRFGLRWRPVIDDHFVTGLQ
jgi:hypothetical protein